MLTVGQVAKRSAVKVSTLHFYEEKGLIISTRNNANQRIYDRQILRRISVIKAAQSIGFSLQEIIEMLSSLPLHTAPTDNEWEKLAKIWEEKLDEKINQLQYLKSTLGQCINCGCLSLKNCGLYNPADSNGVHTPGARLLTPNL